MTAEDFNALGFKEKGEAVFANGNFVDNRLEGGFMVQLYRLESFYVEVFYDVEANAIFRFHAFSSVAPLSSYVKYLS